MDDVAGSRQRWRWIVGVAGVLVVLSVAAVFAVSVSTDRSAPGPNTTSPSGTVASSTVEPGSERATGLFPGIWPFASEAEARRYVSEPGVGMFFDARATALEFARVYLAMPAPAVVGTPETAAADPVVTVSLRSQAGSPMVTRVQLRRFAGAGGPHSVVGASTDNIRLDRPAPGQSVGPTVDLAGTGRAFEGTIDVEVRQDGQAAGERLARSFVTGSGGEALGPFSGSLAIGQVTGSAGAVVLTTTSARDGSVQEATVVRVVLRDGSVAGRTRISVFFHRGEELVQIEREVPSTAGVLRVALQELFKGPLPADGAGLSSPFSPGADGLLAGVVIRPDATAVVDLSREVPNASSAAGSEALLEELGATVFQFPTVARVEYRLRGSCPAFWEWLQRAGCPVITRPGRS